MIEAAQSQSHFYETALPTAARGRYRRAHGEGGLDGEVAVLRLRLYSLLEGADIQTDDAGLTTQILRIIDLLIKALRVPGGRGEDERTALEGALDAEAARVLRGETSRSGGGKHLFRYCAGRVEWL